MWLFFVWQTTCSKECDDRPFLCCLVTSWKLCLSCFTVDPLPLFCLQGPDRGTSLQSRISSFSCRCGGIIQIWICDITYTAPGHFSVSHFLFSWTVSRRSKTRLVHVWERLNQNKFAEGYLDFNIKVTDCDLPSTCTGRRPPTHLCRCSSCWWTWSTHFSQILWFG